MASLEAMLMVVTLTTMSFMISPSFSLTSHQLKIDTVPAAPALLPNTVPVSPSTKISPDISPLLPSSGGVMPSTDSASIPIIPSTPSQNPDEVAAFSPDSAVSPSGHLSDSSAVTQSMIRSLKFAVFMVLFSCWTIHNFAV
ncbi:hypothetical protein DCAR_0102535 [Daucus carota subsp. sativus]|uniref:Uncharacterized protein n=1 Tax=Daucus carota subsp. sativus TaxID=79200 RepID=A0AAF0W506_DAUCS|nr:hypothetical protein DCAR_0102535 [Daucus carota subsp. sativus]